MRRFVAILGGAFLWLGTAQAEIKYIDGPGKVDIGDMATLDLPGGARFVRKEDCKEFYQMTENFYTSSAQGVLIQQAGVGEPAYLVFFEFEDIGYIKDAATEKLDADEMWTALTKDSVATNKERQSKGWAEMTPLAWEIKPNYNASTQRLEWAYRFRSGAEEVVNFNTRILGRRGVMRATLVPDGKDYAGVISGFNMIIQHFEFKSGNKYAEWLPGDRVAKYGLAALVVGGATAAAVNSGLLGKLWKFIVAAFVGFFALLKKLWKTLTGKSDAPPAQQPEQRRSQSGSQGSSSGMPPGAQWGGE